MVRTCLLSKQHSILSTFTAPPPFVQTLADAHQECSGYRRTAPQTIFRQHPFRKASRSYGTVQAASVCTPKRILMTQLHRLCVEAIGQLRPMKIHAAGCPPQAY